MPPSRLHLDAPQPDWQRRLRAAGVFAFDAAVAIVAGIAALLMGGSFWITTAVVLAVCYAVSLFRSPAAPRSAFVLARSGGRTAPPTPAEPEAFGEDALEVDPLRG
ncbi:MAG: hypothetical protein LC791_13575 [Acidobacteria bacterium]|nr:hypothetical protein [Acidobacteriota bacterium]